MYLVFDGHNNKEKKMETKVSQGFLITSIFFFIYISGVFDRVLKINNWVTFLSFVDDLKFMALGRLVKKVAKTLKNIAQVEINCEGAKYYNLQYVQNKNNIFSQLYEQWLNQQLWKDKMEDRVEKISFKKEAT